jgi:pilus assembly protein FimV
LTKGEDKDWQQAAALGATIDPKNPLYAGGQVAALEPAPALEDPLADLMPEHEPVEEAIPQAQPEFTHEDLPEVPAPEPIAQAVHEEVAAPLEHSLDFNLDDIGTAAPAPAAEVATAPPHVDFDLGEPEPVHEAIAEPELTLPDLEIPSLHVPEPAPTPAPAALDFDLSGISLELNPEDKPAEKHEAAAPLAELHVPEIAALDTPAPTPMHAEPDALPDLDIGLETIGDYSNNAEMATKLDLAAAYHEIGDKEGARELLDEVIKGGSPEQIEKAQALLAKLG